MESGRSPLILDGARLAAVRSAGLAARAERVVRRRGRGPRLGLVAFAPAGEAPRFVPRKVRACAAVGVEALPVILPADCTTEAARASVERAVATLALDALFLEFPVPDHVGLEPVVAAMPEALDVDTMTAGRVQRYLSEGEGPPPLTVSAGLALLDHYGVNSGGRDGVVVAERSPFTSMFREALVRRGARMRPLLDPGSPELARGLAGAELVVAAAFSPGLVRSVDLAPGAVAIDAGYFNPGGRGDIDTSGGVDHLTALAPVPGGIGPMTVSMLVERVIAFAESS